MQNITFKDFCTKNRLVVNSKQSFAMLFNRSRANAFPPEFSIGSTAVLTVRKTHRILGVLIQDDLKYEAQTKEMVRRAAQTTWVLRRMQSLGVNQGTLVNYWKAEGRVHLELACPVWNSSLTVAQSQDRAQRMAMAAIAGRWEPSHTRQLLELGLERLTLPDLCPANGPRLKASGYVCPDRSQAAAGEACPYVPDSRDPDSKPL